jgi:hypothetical protein
MGGFSNRPKTLRGAFVEFGLSLPPAILVFQYNPEQLTRSRGLSFNYPGSEQACPPATGAAAAAGGSAAQGGAQAQQVQTPTVQQDSLRKYHLRTDDLLKIQREQVVTVQEESISFDIKLDASDKLNDGDFLTGQFGISPQLATLELMCYPKSESLLGSLLSLVSSSAFSFTRGDNPPLILFIHGRKRVLPVNINSMNIVETEYLPDLNPIRATVSVGLTVIEGTNLAFGYTKAMKEAMSLLNLANIGDIADVVIPG